MKHKIMIQIMMIAALMLAGCQPAKPARLDPLNGSAWQLRSASGFTLLPGSQLTAEFLDGQLSGFGGCNRFSGGYQASQGQFKVDSLAVTEMACLSPQGIMEQEAQYLNVLSQAAAYQLEGERLLLASSQGGALTFIPLR
jgi:heat shock protein HslJ